MITDCDNFIIPGPRASYGCCGMMVGRPGGRRAMPLLQTSNLKHQVLTQRKSKSHIISRIGGTVDFIFLHLSESAAN